MTKRVEVNTEQADQGTLKPHGSVRVEVQGNIIRYLVRGPFNEELNQLFDEIQNTLVSPMVAPKEPWGDLTIFQESAMETPGSLEIYAKTIQAQVDQGLAPIATAFVLAPDIEGANLMGRLYANVYAKAGLKFRVFQNESEAETWLRGQLPGTHQGEI